MEVEEERMAHICDYPRDAAIETHIVSFVLRMQISAGLQTRLHLSRAEKQKVDVMSDGSGRCDLKFRLRSQTRANSLKVDLGMHALFSSSE